MGVESLRATLDPTLALRPQVLDRPHEAPHGIGGTVERELILGGRVLTEKARSTYMDKPFEGYGLSGYDDVSKEFWGTWNAPGSC